MSYSSGPEDFLLDSYDGNAHYGVQRDDGAKDVISRFVELTIQLAGESPWLLQTDTDLACIYPPERTA